MNDSDSFGQWLKSARRARDLTREALAELVSCAAPTLAKIEQGSRRPSRELAMLLLEGLQVPPDERAQVLRLARLPRTMQQAADSAGAPHSAQGAPLGTALRTSALPAVPTPLIGRVAEQAEVLRRLGDPACRLLTLVGPGGIGKTRLALQVAAAAHFADGVAWVELAALGAAMHVAQAIAAAVGCALAGSDAPEAQLLAWLRERRQLIVLDNLEHLLDAAPLIAAILRRAPSVRLLATSRERLRIQGEWVIEVHGLVFPDDRDRRPETRDKQTVTAPSSGLQSPVSSLSSSDLERYDAVLLFLTRARQVSGDFALTPANRQAVARICRLLNGMPLGIELAAAWTRTLSCEEIADEIARGLDFLALADRDSPPRHHSMRAVFDHSWQLLSDRERRVLAALSVFRGGFTRDAVAAVMISEHDDPQLKTENPGLPLDQLGNRRVEGSELLSLLAALVDKSLIRATRDAAGVSRYTMHELIRQYAAERLGADASMQQRVAALHGRYYAALLQGRLPDLFSAGHAAAFVELEPELDNLRQAWAWAVGQRDTAALSMMGQALQSIYEDRGWLQEGELLFGHAAQALRAAIGDADGAARDTRRTLGHVFGRYGYFLSRRGQFRMARNLLQESLTLLRDGEWSLALADTLMNLGLIAYQQGEYSAASGWLQESITITGALHEQFYQVLGLTFQGMVALAQGEYAEAQARLEQALAIVRVNGQPRGLAMALSFLGRTALMQGRLDEAQALLRESVAVSVSAHDRWAMGYALHHLGLLALTQGEVAEAHFLQHEAAEIFAALGERHAHGLALASLGDAALALGDEAAARRAFADALRLAVEAQILPVGGHALLAVARLYLHDDRLMDACTLLVVVGQHPAVDHAVRSRAEELRAEIVAKLPVSVRSAAEDSARADALGQLMAQVYASTHEQH
jgi:predicted ATPase/transcriptional regulator with XRE-family HTH domain/Tfp pilus assembly protein PilF